MDVRKVMSDDRSDAGRPSHVVGPYIAKLHWLIDVRARGTIRMPDAAERRSDNCVQLLTMCDVV